MHITPGFSPVNALWSLLLFAIVIWKIYRLRKEIHTLVENLKTIGDPFIRRDLDELKRDVHRITARLVLNEEETGISRSAENG